jgi:general stress protein YciG
MAGRKRSGFAGMDSEKQREIARRGGRAAHQKGTAHEFTADEARAAGRKGGVSVSRDREYMSRIGRAGGRSSRAGRSGGNPAPSAGTSEQSPGGRIEETQPPAA